MALVVAPKGLSEAARLAEGLNACVETDPTLRIKTDRDKAAFSIEGSSEGQLNALVDRLQRDFHVKADFGKPRILYLATIRKKARGEARYDHLKYSYAHIVIEVEPLSRGSGVVFVDAVRGRIPDKFIIAVEKGADRLHGIYDKDLCPVTDIKINFVDGSYDADVSNVKTFQNCATQAARAACRTAGVYILEPIVECEVSSPEQFMGDVIRDLNGRRAMIQEPAEGGEKKIVRCAVPASEMFGYDQTLRALTQGQASFVAEPSHYAEVSLNRKKASDDPHTPDEPPSASAGRPVIPIRPKPGLSGGARRLYPPESDD